MDKEELKRIISEVLNCDRIEGIILLTLKDGTTSLLNLDNTDKESILNEYVKAVNNKCITEEYDLKNYSTADERQNCFYVFDSAELPDCFHKMQIKKPDHEHIPLFNIKKNKLSDINGIIVILSNGERELVLYKNVYTVEIIGVKKRIIVYHSGNRFKKAENDMLRLTPDFDVVLAGNKFIITNLPSIERIQQLRQITLNLAISRLNDIDKIKILSNLEKAREWVKDDYALAKKVIKIVSESPVLYKGIQNEKIIAFAKKKEAKFGSLTYSEDNTKIEPKTKKEMMRFLAILNNDLLWSELTEDDYLSPTKDLL